MSVRRVHEWLYLTNATILITHQIDSAYWSEWEMFGLPGGIQFFLALNVPIVLVVLLGLRGLTTGARSGTVISWLVVCGGLFAAAFHGFHLVNGDRRFILPLSVALLIGTAIVSAAQAVSLLTTTREALNSRPETVTKGFSDA